MRPASLRISPRAFAETWLWRNGARAPAAALAVLAAVILHLALVAPQASRLSALEQAIARQRAAPVAMPARTEPATDTKAVIAAAAPADELVARMVVLARAEGIALPAGEYQLRRTADAAVVQVQVTQPVRATYPQLRRYAEAVLRSMPNASLDQLTARRENVGQPQLEAKLRWSLWLPRADAKAPTP